MLLSRAGCVTNCWKSGIELHRLARLKSPAAIDKVLGLTFSQLEIFTLRLCNAKFISTEISRCWRPWWPSTRAPLAVLRFGVSPRYLPPGTSLVWHPGSRLKKSVSGDMTVQDVAPPNTHAPNQRKSQRNHLQTTDESMVRGTVKSGPEYFSFVSHWWRFWFTSRDPHCYRGWSPHLVLRVGRVCALQFRVFL